MMQEPPVLLTGSNWRGIERRSVERTDINKDALVFLGGQVIARPCLVRDVTRHSVGISLKGTAILPTTFDLSFDGFRSTYKCELVWRQKDLVGAIWKSA